MSEVPESLKFLQNYLLRAKEVETKDPIISYYCRFYAAKAAIEKIQNGTAKNKDAEVFVLGLMDQLDKDKQALAENEAIKNETIGYAHVENFALKIFLNADNADRNGQATKITAKTFLASSIFLEILKGFGDGELEPEIIQKIKYAKFKAADIMKAFKEGKQPTAGPPGGDEYMNASSPASPSAPPSTSTTSNSTAPSAPPPSKPVSSSLPEKGIPVYKAPAPSAPVNFSALNISDGEELDDEMVGYSEEDRKSISAAGKHAKFAMSALLYDDLPTAMKNLQLAMDLLKPIKIIEDL